MTKKIIKVASVYIDEFGFCRIDLDTSRQDHMGEEEAQEICDTVYEICQGKPHKILTDASRVNGSVAPKSRRIIRNHPGMLKVRKAEAFVSKNLATNILINFYIKFDRPPNPTKAFTSIEDAIDWLQTQKI